MATEDELIETLTPLVNDDGAPVVAIAKAWQMCCRVIKAEPISSEVRKAARRGIDLLVWHPCLPSYCLWQMVVHATWIHLVPTWILATLADPTLEEERQRRLAWAAHCDKTFRKPSA